MAISGDYARMNPADPNGAVRPAAKARKAAPAQAAKASPARATKARPDEVDVHQADRLRDSVTKLIETGDIAARDNGTVRPARVAEARQHVQEGTYGQRDVLASIVDRLLDQWQI
jgi:anti-sigma28 factor (negative regulator of flagellin synthesis)